jgi:DGQHR domain-containing protein
MTASSSGGKRRKRRKSHLTPEERQQRRTAKKHKVDIRTTFVNAGFEHIRTRDKQIEIHGRQGELDAIYMFENVLVCVEDTQSSRHDEVIDHLRKKVEFYVHLQEHKQKFFQVLAASFPELRNRLHKFGPNPSAECHIIHVYCSLETLDKTYKSRYADTCKFMDYPSLQYFLSISKTIHRSTRFELFKFLGLELKDIGTYRSGADVTKYDALLLPETASSFPTGHKLVSFLVDPQMLLERSYVLRSDSWMDTDCLYQRLLSKNKIKSMREYLVQEGRVFVNNIIATLSADCVIVGPPEGRARQSEMSSLNRIVPVQIQIPRAFNCIGIIDGQHRLYSYHEADDRLDKKIEPLRGRQHLLVTGIVYPQDEPEFRRQRFEARLFLEINDKQKRVKGDLKQAIERIVQPESATAIAKAVVQSMAQSGPLTGKLEVHFYDVGKIKTTSIVSYGMKHIVALDSEHSFYKHWEHPKKGSVKRNRDTLKDYVAYCTSQVNMFVSAFKSTIPPDMWTTDRRHSRALTTTTINGLIFCLRRLIESDRLSDFAHYREAFGRMSIDFAPAKFVYKSSHWKSLGEKVFTECFD